MSNLKYIHILQFFAIITIWTIKSECQLPVAEVHLRHINFSAVDNADFFAIQHQRQFDNNLKNLENKLLELQENIKSRIETTSLVKEFLHIKLREYESIINPQELIDEDNYYCIQQNRGLLPTLTQLTNNATACQAKAVLANFYTTPANTLTNLKNYYANQHTNQLKECKKKFNVPPQNHYVNCITTAVQTTMTVTNSNSNVFRTQLESARCATMTKVKEVFDCYSNMVYNVVGAIGETRGRINYCITAHKTASL